jgi:lipoyl(octanoyl) transferase
MICQVQRLERVDYSETLRLQRQGVALRKAGTIPDALLLLEHPHVYTLGRNARKQHLLVSDDFLATMGAQVFETDRGGDITYHGPGQLVGYPILDLTRHRRDVAWYMRSLEEVFIRVAAHFSIRAHRLHGATGVWVGDEKLVAMGIHISRWVTSHGFAFNVNTDLHYFDYIIPCGLRDKGVTSLAKLLGKPVDMNGVIERVIENFGEVFDLEMLAGQLTGAWMTQQEIERTILQEQAQFTKDMRQIEETQPHRSRTSSGERGGGDPSEA